MVLVWTILTIAGNRFEYRVLEGSFLEDFNKMPSLLPSTSISVIVCSAFLWMVG